MAGASCALDFCNYQKTEVEESIGERPSTSLVISNLGEDHSNAGATSGEDTPVQNVCCDVEKQVQSIGH